MGPQRISNYGQVMAKGLESVYTTVEDKFTPHSVHCYYNSPDSSKNDLVWEMDQVSEGNNFVNRSGIGREGNKISCFINSSFTTRNSFNNSMDKYTKYQDLIKKRRAEGKTEDDDDDDDIKKVEVPFKFQVPFPKQLRELPVKQLKSVESDGIEVRLPPGGGLEVSGDDISFFIQLKNPGKNKFVGLCQLADVLDFLTYKNNVGTIQERMIYFHDDDFTIDNYLSVQARVQSKQAGMLLLELEVFNLNGVQVCTIFQQSLITTPAVARL